MSSAQPARQPFGNAAFRLNQMKGTLTKDAHGPRKKPGQPRLGSPSDPQDVFEYDYEIWQHSLATESDHLPSPPCFDPQHSVTPAMRTILVDWMQDMYHELHLHTETLFLSVRLVDAYLSDHAIPSSRLQLLGCVAIYLTSKSEETNAVASSDLIYYSGGAFTYEDLAEMELQLFVAADFIVSRPTVYQFLIRYAGALGCAQLAMNMIRYIGEFSLLSSECIGVKPSLLAGAVVCVARALLKEEPLWPAAIQQYTDIAIGEVRPVAAKLLASIKDMVSADEWVVTRAFADAGRARVSTFLIPDELSMA
jgi:hypothetical protein